MTVCLIMMETRIKQRGQNRGTGEKMILSMLY